LFFVQEKISIQFLLASLKTLPNTKSCSESGTTFLFWLSFAHISRFSPVVDFLQCTDTFTAASGTILKITGGFRKARKSSLKRGVPNPNPSIIKQK
jgi:hypothetical protein